MIKTYWLQIEPVDTLFFRGTESMVAGENHEVDTMFPPMPSTITGALRTAIMVQHGIDPFSYQTAPEEIIRSFPILGTPDDPGFSVLGPLLSVKDTVLFPAPAHWMANISTHTENNAIVAVQEATVLDDNGFGLVGSVSRPFWVHNPQSADVKALGGHWINLEAFNTMRAGLSDMVYKRELTDLGPDEPSIVPTGALISREERVGIALNPGRTVRHGHLFASRHIRLNKHVKMLVGIKTEHNLELDKNAIIQVGGEQRLCAYKKVEPPKLPDFQRGRFLYAISPVRATLSEQLAKKPRCSGKLIRAGGWDMKRRFHKPLRAWFPAGTVITKSEDVTQIPDEFLII